MLLLLWHLNKRFLILLQRMEITLIIALHVENILATQASQTSKELV